MLLRIEQLMRLASHTRLPLIATVEEPVSTKGDLLEPLQRLLPEEGQLERKWTYDCCQEPDIESAIMALGRSQIAVAGGETDVCVLQTVLSLLEMQFEVFVIEDCVFSSAADTTAALRRMRNGGAIQLTYKELFYELQGRVRTEPQPAGLLTPLEIQALYPVSGRREVE